MIVVTVTLIGYVAGTLGYPIPQAGADVQTQKSNADAKTSCCSCHEGTCSEQCCCKARASRSRPPAKPGNAAKVSFGVTWVPGIAARDCRGESTSWTQLPLALPPPAWLTWEYGCGFVHSLVPGTITTSSRSTPPPSPPPRSC